MKRDCETGRAIGEVEEEEKEEGEEVEEKAQEQVETEDQIRATTDSFFGQSVSEQEEVCADRVDGQCQD